MKTKFQGSRWFKRTFFSSISMLLGLQEALSAAHFIVANLNDSGKGSLRICMEQAVSGDTIHFQSGLTGTIYLQSPLPIIDESLIIYGNNGIVIDGQEQFPGFFIFSGTSSISNLVLQNLSSLGGDGGGGFTGAGGGGMGGGAAVFVNSGSLTLTNVNYLR